jgi:predicted PurR-regulated permease PerM
MPEPPSSRTTAPRFLHVLGSLVLIVACLYWAQKVLIPFALAVLLTFILSPLVTRLQRRGLPRSLAVALVVGVVFAGLVGLVWGITEQLRTLLVEVPQHRTDIAAKVLKLKGTGTGPVAELIDMVRDIAEKFRGPGPLDGAEKPVPVVLVNEQWPLFNWAAGVVGPVLEALLSGAFMAILVVFMLAKQEDLRNRFFHAVGQGQIAATTRAVDEATQRISRFLLTQLLINVGFGIVWAVALFFMPGGPDGTGVPYAFLWGCLAAALRFVPYVGTWIALAFPLLLSIALSPVESPWFQPLLLGGTYFVLEMVTGNVLEPLLFGHHAGVSPVALLVAAVFWGWLWGPIGLVLSTPLTVCLVVLGKYVPQLQLFAVFLGEEAPLKTEIGYYQRLLARDEDEATDLVLDYVANHEPDTVYDDVLVPALVMAQRDEERGTLGPRGQRFILDVTQRILDDLLAQQQFAEGAPGPEKGKALVLGCPGRGEVDEVALRMLAQLLRAERCPMEVFSEQALTSEVVTWAQEEKPTVVCIGSLPPGGVAQASYLCKRLRLAFPDLKIIGGRWGDTENIERVVARLKEAGANQVVTSLLAARQEIVPLMRVAAESISHESLVISEERHAPLC